MRRRDASSKKNNTKEMATNNSGGSMPSYKGGQVSKETFFALCATVWSKIRGGGGRGGGGAFDPPLNDIEMG